MDGETGIGVEDGAGAAVAAGAATTGAVEKAGGSSVITCVAGGTETVNNR